MKTILKLLTLTLVLQSLVVGAVWAQGTSAKWRPKDADWPRECAPDDKASETVRSYSLGGRRYLFEFPCDRSAYNVENAYALDDESQGSPKIQVLEFPAYADIPCCDVDSAEVDRFLKAAPKIVMKKTVDARAFDAKAKELITLVKGRGMGDCGEYARYGFPDGKPEIREFKMKLNCDGQFAYPESEKDIWHSPAGWTTYPASKVKN